MSDSDVAEPSAGSDSSGNRQFATTRWTLVVAAGRRESPEAQRALAELCATYWYPLYAFVRRQGRSVHEAQDLTQEFFARLLEFDRLQQADRQRGRFRSFLLASLQNFLANDWRDRQAAKRGGGVVHLPLDFQEGERRYALEPVDTLTPQRIYERRWALTLLERALERLRAHYVENGKAVWFDALKGCLEGGTVGESYAEIAQRLDSTEAAVKVAAHRLRKKCGELLREEIAQTVDDPREVDQELAALLDALAPV